MQDDFYLPFQVGDGAVRGRIVRLGPAIDEILKAHAFADGLSELVGEAAVLSALMGGALKFEGKFIFQATGSGAVKLLVADYTSDGALRATATTATTATASDLLKRGLGALLGAGTLAMTVDQGADMERYQGVTSISGDSLEAAAVGYFDQSEQIPTAVRLCVGRVEARNGGPHWRAGGVIVQFVPGEGGERGGSAPLSDDEQDIWSRAAAFLNTTQPDELIDPLISAETLLYRLFHEDGVRVFDGKPLRAACSCNAERIAAVLSRYAPEELADLVEDGRIKVSCEFCRRDYAFDSDGADISA